MSDYEIEKIGRALAGMLRHGKSGIEMDSQGYADIRDVLARVKTKNPRMNWLRAKHLEALVVTDPKGRYSIVGNDIRATYGHTIDLDLDLDNENIPDELFYPASSEEAEILMESGIVPTDRSMVHLSLTFADAYRAGSVRMDDPMVLVVDTGLCIEEGYDIGKAARTVFLCREVPPDAIMVAEPEDYDFDVEDD
jgi:putative RNA 2'-phosphotransferase